MKKIILCFVLLGGAFSVKAALDPFSVYNLKAPENCVDKSLEKEKVGGDELQRMGVALRWLWKMLFE